MSLSINAYTPASSALTAASPAAQTAAAPAVASSALQASTATAPAAAGNLAATATSLASESALAASLGSSAAATVYTPTGLLSSLQQAGTVGLELTIPATGSQADTAQLASNALDQAVLNELAAPASSSGIYTGSGNLGGMSEQAAANWANLLKAQPGLAGNAIADSINAGVVATLQTQA